jgi:uncharacterized membrane protein YphA (DoxX/SURF4 family)
MTTSALQSGAAPAQYAGWSLPLRIVFRFFCCYLLLTALPMPSRVSIVDPIPGARAALRPVYQGIWRVLSPWAAVNIFHLSGTATTYFPTGSTDTTLGYIQNLWYIVVAAAATLVWSIVDRRRPDYRALHDWLRVLVRYTLAIAMFWYGIGKVFPNQFARVDGDGGIGRLIEPYGQFSPMGVLWTFMGTSRAYTIFTGLAELTGCVFLLFRRTVILGALVSAAALIHVIVLDFSFDIDVKLGALNYFLLAIFLLAPDARRLLNLLVLNRATSPAVLRPLWPARPWTARAVAVCKVLFIISLVVPGVQSAWQSRQVARPKGPLYGIYDVEKFVEYGRDRPGVATESGRWSKVAFVDLEGSTAGVTIRNSDDSIVRYQSVSAHPNPRLTW